MREQCVCEHYQRDHREGYGECGLCTCDVFVPVEDTFDPELGISVEFDNDYREQDRYPDIYYGYPY